MASRFLQLIETGARCELTFLSQVTAEQFKEALSVQKAVFEHLQIDKDHRRRDRSPLSQMVMWAETRGYFGSIKPEGKKAQTDGEVPVRLYAPRGQARQLAADIKLRSTPCREAYMLGSHLGDFVNTALQKQLNDLVAYLRKGRREVTIKKNIHQIKLLLGWLHREKGISLEALSLDDVCSLQPCENTGGRLPQNKR